MSKLANASFLTRTMSGIVFFIVVVGAVLLSYTTFVALLAVICVGGMWEFYRMAGAKGMQPQKYFGMIAGALLLIGWATMFTKRLFIFPVLLTVLLTFFALALPFFIELYRKKENPIANIAVTLTGLIYVAVPLVMFCFMSVLYYSRLGEPLSSILNDFGNYNPTLVLAYLFIVWANDVGAYIIGVLFGKHKLFERISPKKSWEGFFGGLIFAAAVSVGMGFLIACWPVNVAFWAGLGVIVAVTGVLGDLVESMFKRSAGIKDSGKIMPGHGGFLDRFDALLLSAPFVFIYFAIFAF